MSKCIPWAAARNKNGYGVVWIGGKTALAHRVAYALFHPNENIDDLCVLHRCDNPPCINIEHLRVGTVADNNADMKMKGRARGARGSASGKAKLTNAQVAEIRSAYVPKKRGSLKRLADRFGVAKFTILKIVQYKSWKGEQQPCRTEK